MPVCWISRSRRDLGWENNRQQYTHQHISNIKGINIIKKKNEKGKKSQRRFKHTAMSHMGVLTEPCLFYPPLPCLLQEQIRGPRDQGGGGSRITTHIFPLFTMTHIHTHTKKRHFLKDVSISIKRLHLLTTPQDKRSSSIDTSNHRASSNMKYQKDRRGDPETSHRDLTTTIPRLRFGNKNKERRRSKGIGTICLSFTVPLLCLSIIYLCFVFFFLFLACLLAAYYR